MSMKRRRPKSNLSERDVKLVYETYNEFVRVNPPNDLPVYRLLTGKDDSTFCRRVSEALKLGYRLYGSPSITFNGTDVIAAQAVIWNKLAPQLQDPDDDIPF